MATSGVPNQQQQPQLQQQVPSSYAQTMSSNTNPSSSSSSSSPPSGSIGPFLAVISVLVVLAIVSCLLGRYCIGREETPLESIKYRGSCFARIRQRLRRCFSRDVRHGGGGGRGGVKVAAAAAPPPLTDEKGPDDGN